jgi:flavin reductase (NADH)
MRNIASAVYLVTARGAEGDAGMTATAACSLSFDPLSVLVCVNRSASFFQILEETGQFVLNVLRYDLHAMPALRTSLSSLACRVADAKDFGTHRIFMGEVMEVHNRDGLDELLYCQGAFRALHPTPVL